jgi:hypothetical protein
LASKKEKKPQTVRAVVEALRLKYPINGSFTLRPNESMRKAVSANGVPSACGVYVVTALSRSSRIVYIGKAGTMTCSGKWKSQKLRGRLTNSQGRLSRETFFRHYIATHRLKGLQFQWFVTFDEKVAVLPFLAEAELLQAYFTEHRRLPELNAGV